MFQAASACESRTVENKRKLLENLLSENVRRTLSSAPLRTHITTLTLTFQATKQTTIYINI